MKEKLIQHKEFFYLFFAVAISLFVLLFRIKDNYMIYLSTDELGQWATAAWLNGDDWSPVVNTIPYYSYLYGVFLAVIYRIVSSPTLMYQIAVFVNGLAVSAVVVICYCICKELDDKRRPVVWTFIGVFCSLTAANIVNGNLTWSETPLTLISWSLMFTVVRLFHNRETIMTSDLAVFVFLLFGGYAIHQRFLGIVVSGYIVLLVLSVKKRLTTKQLVVVALITVILLFGHIIFKHIYQEEVYHLSQRTSLGNDYGSMFVLVKNVFSMNGIKSIIMTMAGQLFYFGAATYLIGYFGVTYVINKYRAYHRQEGLDIYLYLFFILSYVFSFGISCLAMSNPVRIDHALYGRYIENLFGVFVIMGWLVLFENITDTKIIGIMCVVFLLFGLVANENVIKLVGDGQGFQYVCAPAISLALFRNDVNTLVGFTSVYTVLIFMLIIICIALVSNCKKPKEFYLGIVVFMATFPGLLTGLLINEKIILRDKRAFYDSANNVIEKKKISGDEDWIYYESDSLNIDNQMGLACVQYLLKTDTLGIKRIKDGIIPNEGTFLCEREILSEFIGKYDILGVSNGVMLLSTSSDSDKSEIDLKCFKTNGFFMEDGLVSNGEKSETLMYGPYVELEEGDYSFTVDMTVLEGDDVVAVLDAVSNGGNNTFNAVTVNLDDFENYRTKVTLPVTLNEPCSNFELRVMTDDAIEITGVYVSR